MDFLKIKNLVKQNGDKFVFVENGEPDIVVMSFREYEKIVNHGANTRADFADLSGEELRETELVVPAGLESVGLPVRLEDIRLEDLPV